MATSNYKEVERSIEALAPYQHGSSHGDCGATNYVVYSYTTLIFEYDMQLDKVLYFNNKYYSSTTSRLQNIIKRHYEI